MVNPSSVGKIVSISADESYSISAMFENASAIITCAMKTLSSLLYSTSSTSSLTCSVSSSTSSTPESSSTTSVFSSFTDSSSTLLLLSEQPHNSKVADNTAIIFFISLQSFLSLYY